MRNALRNWKKDEIIISEDDYNQKYTITIPPQKPEITVDDIAVFIFTDYFAIWVRGSAKEVSKKFYDEQKHIYSQMRSLNVDRDYEIWENFVQPIKNGTIPSISKKKFLDNSFQITISFPLAAIDKDRLISLHKLYSSNHTNVQAKVDYRMKLPPNPHYVRRSLENNDGNIVEVFTVADEGSQYIKELKSAMATNSSSILQNNTVTFVNNYLNTKDQNYTIHKINQ